MFGLSGLAGRIVTAVFYGVCVFVVIYIIGIVLTQVTQGAQVGEFLKSWAALLGFLAGLATFFTNSRPV
jgi:uncharacterized membrane protein YhaH (DUF805 family)